MAPSASTMAAYFGQKKSNFHCVQNTEWSSLSEILTLAFQHVSYHNSGKLYCTHTCNMKVSPG